MLSIDPQTLAFIERNSEGLALLSLCAMAAGLIAIGLIASAVENVVSTLRRRPR